MKQEKFAKLFDLENGGQVLLTTAYDQTMGYLLHMHTVVDGVYRSQAGTYNDPKALLDMFESFNQKDAEEFFNMVEAYYGGPQEAEVIETKLLSENTETNPANDVWAEVKQVKEDQDIIRS